MSQLISRRLRDRTAITPEIGRYAPPRRRADRALEFSLISSVTVLGAPYVGVLRGGARRHLSRIDGTRKVEARYPADTDDIVGVVRNLDSLTRDDSHAADGATRNDTIATTLLHSAPAYCHWLTHSLFVDRDQTRAHHATFDIYEVRT